MEYLFFVFVGTGLLFVIYRILVVNGINPIGWFRKVPLPGIPTTSWVKPAITSTPAKAVLGVVALTLVLYLAAPGVYQKWIGAHWQHFFALLIGVVGAVVLISAKSLVLNWIGVVVLAVSVSPLLLSTTIGQKVANVYNGVVDEEGYVETPTRKERLVRFGGGIQRVERDGRPWRVGGQGDVGCIGIRYSTGIADDFPLFEVQCFGGEEVDDGKWPWVIKMPKVNEPVRCPSKPTARGEKEYRKVPDLSRAECNKLFANKTVIEFANVGTATEKVRVYAKLEE
jgi:hypothetical protein